MSSGWWEVPLADPDPACHHDPICRCVKELNAGTNRCVTWVGLETRAMTRLPQRFDLRDDRRELVRRVREIRVEMFGKHGVSGLAEIRGDPTPHLSAGQNHHPPRLGGTGLAGQPGDPDVAGGSNHRVHRQIDQQTLNQGSTHTGKVGTRMSHPDGGSRDE